MNLEDIKTIEECRSYYKAYCTEYDSVIHSINKFLLASGVESDTIMESVKLLVFQRDEALKHRDELREKLNEYDAKFRSAKRKCYCAYCAWVTPESDNPEVVRQSIIDHVIACEKNIFRIEADVAIKERDEVLKLCKELSDENADLIKQLDYFIGNDK